MAIRRLVADSWARSRAQRLDPEHIVPELTFSDADLRAYRAEHPLHAAMPVIQQLLIRHSLDAGLIIAVGDADGRLLWVDGDRGTRVKAESISFVEGADWSENRVGTTAPGTALALNRGVQIIGDEHFVRLVHPWSCTAAPVHDPVTGAVIGVVDITGDDRAGSPPMLPLVEATVAAVEAELRLLRLSRARSTEVQPAAAARTRSVPVVARPLLEVLGRNTARLTHTCGSVDLSLRHSELMLLLAWHGTGLSGERLAGLLYGETGRAVTVRAEIARLRRVLPAALGPASGPYRLPTGVDLDARRVLGFLRRGAHRVALGTYAGAVLPGSDAPGVVEIRDEIRATLRTALLSDASVDTLLDYAHSSEGADDLELWRECLRLLPARSPRRANVVSRIERLEATLA